MDADDVVVVGNSLGAAVALAANSPRITARALISPAGFIRLRVDPKLALASAVWLLDPTAEHARRMLRLFVAPGADPPEAEVDWMARGLLRVKNLAETEHATHKDTAS